jgi:hypothetical protein
MEKIYTSFIKFGDKTFMEKLFYDGEIHCNTLNYFSEEEYKDLRTDKYDGADYLFQAKDLKFKHKDELLATAEFGQVYRKNINLIGNIFCLYGVENEVLELTSTSKKLKLNLDKINWGDTAVFIFNTQEFLKRMKTVIENEGFKYNISPLTYYEEKTFEGNLTPFHKRKQLYETQKEVRYWIPNNVNQIKKFYIGNMSDISFIIPKNEIKKLKYDYK